MKGNFWASSHFHQLIIRARQENAQDLKERKYLEEKYSWIEQDKHAFGKKNSAFDFTLRDPAKAERQLNKARNQKEKLNGQINQRAMALLQQVSSLKFTLKKYFKISRLKTHTKSF